jgi:N-acetylglutamate synthase-like GNAT family acetyltransferase
VVAYGWLDDVWGDAEILLAVDEPARGTGAGGFALRRLEEEAAARGLNYIYNVVPGTHPDGAWIRHWLSAHGFHEASRGQLRRQVRHPGPLGAGSDRSTTVRSEKLKIF